MRQKLRERFQSAVDELGERLGKNKILVAFGGRDRDQIADLEKSETLSRETDEDIALESALMTTSGFGFDGDSDVEVHLTVELGDLTWGLVYYPTNFNFPVSDIDAVSKAMALEASIKLDTETINLGRCPVHCVMVTRRREDRIEELDNICLSMDLNQLSACVEMLRELCKN